MHRAQITKVSCWQAAGVAFSTYCGVGTAYPQAVQITYGMNEKDAVSVDA